MHALALYFDKSTGKNIKLFIKQYKKLQNDK